MESTVYYESPHAEYLEGQGQAEQTWQSADCNSKQKSFNSPSYAPVGPPAPMLFHVEKLVSGFKAHAHRRSKTLDTLRDMCSAVTTARVSPSHDDPFLDQFRYSIIASQLLLPDSKPQGETATCQLDGPSSPDATHSQKPSFSLQGASATLALSFFAAWTLHWAKVRSLQSAIPWWSVAALFFVLLALVFGIYGYANKKASQVVYRDAADALSDLVTQCCAMDTVASSALTLVQEVEMVSRGYDISTLLPPVSRLDLKASDRHCHNLRRGLANVLSSAITCYLDAHTALRTSVDPINMQKYHDIYELSREDYRDMVQGLTTQEDPESLRGLRASMMRLFTARQIWFCDLLALPSESPVSDSRRWTTIIDEIVNVASVLRTSSTALANLINETDNAQWGTQSTVRSREHSDREHVAVSDLLSPTTPGKEKVRAQLRRLEALSYSIRGLNAKMLSIKDEANTLMETSGESSVTGSMLGQQYESIGADLKSLVSEWERGRKTMLPGFGAAEHLSESRSPSGPRSPQSPAQSLGGITAVNEGGSPCAGFSPKYDGTASDEEIFEAMSSPVKSKRLSMTREEKKAKVQEDRRKRATLQDQRDATTSMLRELETVIKHRPRGMTASGISSV